MTAIHDGTGLGLPVVRQLVEIHGGRFDIESEPGVGTRVTISLPAARTVEAPAALHAA